MLVTHSWKATVPVARLGPAREFYEGVLGLSPRGSHRQDVDLFYELGGGTRLVVIDEVEPMRPPRSAAFVVEDVAATVRELRARGVDFDEFDLPQLKIVDGVATVGERRFAWR